MSDSTLNRFVARGTTATRLAFTPSVPTPSSGPSQGYLFWDTDLQAEYAWDVLSGAWVAVGGGGSGTVTHTGNLTASAVMVGNGSADSKVLASLGTTTTVLHGNAAGLPTFGAVSLTADVSGTLGAGNGGTGITSLGTGVATALGINVGSAGAPVTNGGALGTPASGVATNLTSIPVANATGVLSVANGGTAVSAIPKFSVNKGGTNQTAVVASTYTKVTFGTEVFDTNSNFASSTFTPTVAGKYLITAAITFTASSDTAAMECVLYKNGTLLFENLIRSPSTSGLQIPGTWIVDMNGSTDTLELYTWQGTGSDKIILGDITATYFQGSLLP